MSQTQNDYAAKPLLYIIQPEHHDVHIKMQALVIKKQETLQVEVETVEEEIEINDEEKEKDVEEIIVKEEPKPKRKKRKPISKMNIDEKIDFFTNLPKTMPKSLCLIETDDQSYHGVIMSREEDIVTIRSLNHSDPLELKCENIKAINILGF